MDALIILTSLALIFLLGLFCSWISEKLKIPNILLLVVAGILISQIPYKGKHLIELPELFLTSVSILALVMIVFDSTSRFKLREFDSFSLSALKLSLLFLIFTTVFLSLLTSWAFGIKDIYLVLVFGVLMAGTDPTAVLVFFKDKFHKIAELLKIESVINTPLIVIIPFIILDLKQNIGITPDLVSTIMNQVSPFLSKIVVGIGAGVVMGIIIFKLMRKKYDEHLSPLALIAAALLTYILAENLNGSGVLAVTTLGLFFGNIYVEGKRRLTEFSGTFSIALEILVFVLIGFIITMPLTILFLVKSFLLFVAYLLIRFLTINITFPKRYTLKERIYMSLNVSKGIAVAVMAFMLTTLAIPGMDLILDLVLIFLLYSLIIATITSKFTNFFLELKKVEEETK